MSSQDYIGLTIEEARKLAKERGMILRNASTKGKSSMLTADVVHNRITVTVKDGIVTSYETEGFSSPTMIEYFKKIQ